MANSKAEKLLAAAALLMLGQAVLAQQSAHPANARQWLDSMSSSMRSLDYDGTFVYYHDGKLEAMRIVHQANAGGEKERLMSLTGSAREVLRDDKVVTCIMPDNKSVMVGQSRPRQPYPDVPKDLDSLSPHYNLSDAGDDRVAGMMARVIAITPRDRFRYGYRFWIDIRNHMLLRFELSDEEGNAIEQVMFTGLRVGEGIPAEALEPSLSGDGYNWFRQENSDAGAALQAASPQWTVGQLPVGFEMTDNQRKRVRQGGEHAEHLVYSDGLATVSVYVEKLMDGTRSYTGLSNMGAMNAYGAVVDGHQVTVVGEVPSATVQSMAQSVARRQ